MQPFAPVAAGTVNIDVSASSQRVAIGNGRATQQIRVMNDGSATVWVTFGGDTVTATTTTGMPVGSGVTEVVTADTADGSPLYVAAIAATTTGKIYFSPGDGV